MFNVNVRYIVKLSWNMRSSGSRGTYAVCHPKILCRREVYDDMLCNVRLDWWRHVQFFCTNIRVYLWDKRGLWLSLAPFWNRQLFDWAEMGTGEAMESTHHMWLSANSLWFWKKEDLLRYSFIYSMAYFLFRTALTSKQHEKDQAVNNSEPTRTQHPLNRHNNTISWVPQ